MLAPAVTNFSLPGAIERYATVARVAGWASDSDNDHVAAHKVPLALQKWNHELHVPTMKQYKIDASAYRNLIPKMGSDALASGSPGNNPIQPKAEQIEMLYEYIYSEKQQF